MSLDSIIVRMDLEFNEKVLVDQLQRTPVSIMTDREVDPELLYGFRKRIKEFAYLISEKTDPKYFKKLLERGCKFNLLTKLEGEALNRIKLDYLDYGMIQNFPARGKSTVQKYINNKKMDKLFFKSSTLYIMRGKIFGCPLDSAENPELSNLDSNTPRPIIDHPAFWSALPHITLLEKT